MTMTQPDFPSWFCLAADRRNFQIDPVRDREFLFGEAIWETEIDNRLKRAQLLGEPVRLVWWGQYGIGKTHRLHHTEHLINKNGYRYLTAYVVASDIQDKTGFERLHFELMNALDKEKMREMVSSYLLKVRTDPGSVPPIRDVCRGIADVESALRSFGGDNQQLVTPAWRFLSGLELKGNDLALANVTKSRLDSSLDFTAALGALATIVTLGTGRELLFLIDECENIGRVTNKAAENRWQETIRSLLDVRNVSLVLTVGAERQDGIPKIILQPDIVRRIQKDNYAQMSAFTAPVARSFVEGMLRQWIDAQKLEVLEREELASKGGYNRARYPFTDQAFDKFCEWTVVDPRAAKPSVIIDKLNNVAAEAYFKQERLISRDVLTELGIA
jgi:hypothetical protein